MTMEMNSIDQINFKCNYTKKMDLKTCRENTVIVLVFLFVTLGRHWNKWKEIKIRNNHVNLKQTIIQQSF